MPSPPLLNFEDLLVPIPGDNPAGEPLSFAIRQELEEARKEIDPNDFADDDPMRPTEAKKADWSTIRRIACETLADSCKDLLVAARLTEALVKLHGFAGLRDGLRLFRLLIVECWDRLYPGIEDGDLEVRAGPFNWLDDPLHGARFPHTLSMVPLIEDKKRGYSWYDWSLLQEKTGAVSHEEFEEALASTPREHCQRQVDNLAMCKTEWKELCDALHEKFGELAPGLTGIQRALDDCTMLARQLLEKKGFASVEGSASEAAISGGSGSTSGNSPAQSMTTRADIYRRLAEAADLLQRLEPHSPVPYFIRRAVALGALPFPQLIKALIREQVVLGELNREMGIKEEPPKE